MSSRLNIPVPEELIRAIDEWRRHEPDIPARATAARRLIEAALKEAKKERDAARSPER